MKPRSIDGEMTSARVRRGGNSIGEGGRRDRLGGSGSQHAHKGGGKGQGALTIVPSSIVQG